jgi:hypothetical protein
MILLNDKWSNLYDQNSNDNEIPFGMAQEDIEFYSFVRIQSTVITASTRSGETLTTPSGNITQ